MTPRRVLPAAAVAAGLTPLNSTMIAVALPAISVEFAAPAAQVTVSVVTAYLVATILCQMPAGTIADRMGHARTLTAGRWMFAAGAASAFLAPALGFVVLGRLLMAAGGSLMVPTAMALVRVTVPPERRPSAFGAMGAVMGGAAALGPALGGLLIARFSWRVLFLVNLPLTLLSWLLEPKGFAAASLPAVKRPFDWRRSVVDVSLFSERSFVAGAAIIALQNLAMYALLIQVPFLFRDAGRSGLGLAVMAMTATMAVMSPVGGRIAERVGTRTTSFAGGIIGAVGILLLAQLEPSAGPARVAAPLLLVGLALGLSTGPAQASALSAIEAERSGLAAATMSTLRYVGAIAGTAILGAALGGDANLAQQHVALVVFAAAFVASAGCALALARAK